MTYADLADKVVIITGGAGGIGAVTAQEFLKAGSKVVLVDLSADALAETAAELGAGEDQLIYVAADVTNENDVANYVSRTIETFGRIDVFFNNAGVEGTVASIPDTPLADFQKVLRVNVEGAFLGLRHVLPHLYGQGSGSVINTSSVAGLIGTPNLAAYTTSKHAVVGLTKSAALEAGPQGVRVNSVHPSPVNTRMMRSLEEGFAPGAAEAAKADFEKAIPLGRYGEPIDIANLVLFLASEKSSFINGAQYLIDGGQLA